MILTSKPLSYGTQSIVLKYMSFEKRQHLYLKIPSIRIMEVLIPYQFQKIFMCIYGEHFCELDFDSLNFKVRTNLDRNARISILEYCRGDRFVSYTGIDMTTEKVAEKLVLYYLNRNGAQVKDLGMKKNPKFMLESQPIIVENMKFSDCEESPKEYCTWIKTKIPVKNLETNRVFRDDTIKNALQTRIREDSEFKRANPAFRIPISSSIIAEWNFKTLKIDQNLSFRNIVDYCRLTVRRKRPVGTRLQFELDRGDTVDANLTLLQVDIGGRWTEFEGRRYLTVPIDDTAELNIYENIDDSERNLEIRVDPKGAGFRPSHNKTAFR